MRSTSLTGTRTSLATSRGLQHLPAGRCRRGGVPLILRSCRCRRVLPITTLTGRNVGPCLRFENVAALRGSGLILKGMKGIPGLGSFFRARPANKGLRAGDGVFRRPPDTPRVRLCLKSGFRRENLLGKRRLVANRAQHCPASLSSTSAKYRQTRPLPELRM